MKYWNKKDTLTNQISGQTFYNKPTTAEQRRKWYLSHKNNKLNNK